MYERPCVAAAVALLEVQGDVEEDQVEHHRRPLGEPLVVGALDEAEQRA